MGKKVDGEMGQRISLLRRHRGFTQEYMAEELGISTREYRRIEKGDVDLYQSMIVRIGSVLGMDSIYLYTGKTSYDMCLKRAFEVMPEEKRKQVSELFGDIDESKMPDEKYRDEKWREFCDCMNSLVYYGKDHYNDERLREVPDVDVYARLLVATAPKRGGRGAKTLFQSK